MGCVNPYTVREGDNLWNLAALKLSNPLRWVEIEAENPILLDRTRYSFDRRGREIVRILPGETLCGLEGWDWINNDFQDPSSNEMEVSEKLPPLQVNPDSADGRDDATPWWLKLLALLLATIMFLGVVSQWWKENRQKRKLEAEQAFRAVNTDPTTAGSPMVPGGVTEVNAEQALRDVAARRFGGTHQDFTVLERTVGRVYGTMVVSYRDGTERQWLMSGQQAYQARIRRPNGHVEVIYMLQACGNDLRFGEVAGYQPGGDFRFEPEIAQPAPAPVVEPAVASPAPAAVVPVAVPVEPQRVAAEPTPRGTVQVMVKAPDGNGPHLVQVSGINPVGASIKVSPTGFELRYTELAP